MQFVSRAFSIFHTLSFQLGFVRVASMHTSGILRHTIEIGKREQTLPSHRISDSDRLGVQRLHHPKSPECLHFNRSSLGAQLKSLSSNTDAWLLTKLFRDHWQVHGASSPVKGSTVATTRIYCRQPNNCSRSICLIAACECKCDTQQQQQQHWRGSRVRPDSWNHEIPLVHFRLRWPTTRDKRQWYARLPQIIIMSCRVPVCRSFVAIATCMQPVHRFICFARCSRQCAKCNKCVNLQFRCMANDFIYAHGVASTELRMQFVADYVLLFRKSHRDYCYLILSRFNCKNCSAYAPSICVRMGNPFWLEPNRPIST